MAKTSNKKDASGKKDASVNEAVSAQSKRWTVIIYMVADDPARRRTAGRPGRPGDGPDHPRPRCR